MGAALIQLKGWRANCDIRVVIDHHACVEYLSKYVAKGEPKSPMLKETFNAVMKNVGSNVHPRGGAKAIFLGGARQHFADKMAWPARG
jgi:hypothetical protein